MMEIEDSIGNCSTSIAKYTGYSYQAPLCTGYSIGLKIVLSPWARLFTHLIPTHPGKKQLMGRSSKHAEKR